MENFSYYYLQKAYYYDVGSSSVKYNLNAGNWTKLNSNLNYTDDSIWRHLHLWFENRPATQYPYFDLKDETAKTLPYGLTYQTPLEGINPEYISFSLIDADINNAFYLDDWMSKGAMNDPALAFYREIETSDLDNPYFILKYLANPNHIVILPNHEYYDYSKFFDVFWTYISKLTDNMPSSLRAHFPTFTQTNASLTFVYDNYFLEGFLKLISPIFNTFQFTDAFGKMEFNLTIIYDTTIDLLKQVIFQQRSLNLPMKRIINLELISTKTPDIATNGYYYWNESLYEQNPTLKFHTLNITSRLYRDAYGDKIDPRRYNLDLMLYINNHLNLIDQNALFQMVIDQYLPIILFTGLGIGGATILSNIAILRLKKKPVKL
jgi:hypothetical protein